MEQLKNKKKNIQMTNLVKKIIWFFCRKKKINEAINKNDKILSQLGDQTDYDGMGDWGRFPPIKKNNE